VANRKPIRRALVSVYDKDRLLELGRCLSEAGVEILSTGSTAKTLQAAGISVTEVSSYTGFPEIMGGRVKTLHPKIHSGILADQNNPEHVTAIAELDIAPFDLVVINLYPFASTIASGAEFAECIEQIDIGGPSMLRGAAKNHGSVAVVCKTSQYDHVIESIKAGGFTEDDRRALALEVFRTTAEYDLTIASWLGSQTSLEIPDWFGLIFNRQNSLRYGENPHQNAAFYHDGSGRAGVATAHQVQGKELSYNNINDTDAAVELVAELSDRGRRPAVAIIKHANPCGAALGENLIDAYEKALRCDPVSAFGGIVALGGPIDEATAKRITEIFTEVVIAPSADDAAKAIFAKRSTCPKDRFGRVGQMREFKPRIEGRYFLAY